MKTLLKNPRVFIGTTALAVAAIAVLFSAHTTYATPLQFVPGVQTSAATTSPAFVTTTTTATTTFDAFAPAAGGQVKATNGGTLLLQAAASSTSSVVNVNVQYSQDGIDWYGDAIAPATTTVSNIGVVNSYTWLVGTVATSSRAISVKTPTRYTRFIISATGANAAIWNQFVPVRESVTN